MRQGDEIIGGSNVCLCKFWCTLDHYVVGVEISKCSLGIGEAAEGIVIPFHCGIYIGALALMTSYSSIPVLRFSFWYTTNTAPSIK